MFSNIFLTTLVVECPWLGLAGALWFNAPPPPCASLRAKAGISPPFAGQLHVAAGLGPAVWPVWCRVPRLFPRRGPLCFALNKTTTGAITPIFFPPTRSAREIIREIVTSFWERSSKAFSPAKGRVRQRLAKGSVTGHARCARQNAVPTRV